jgi:hypothetical protein
VSATESGASSNGTQEREPGPRHGANAEPEASTLGDVWEFVRRLPGTVQSGIRTNPVAVVAGVGATAFVVGALCGSRVGRVLMTSLAGYGLRRLIEGPVAREVARYAGDVLKHSSGAARASAA